MTDNADKSPALERAEREIWRDAVRASTDDNEAAALGRAHHFIATNGGGRWTFGAEQASAAEVTADQLVAAMALLNRWTGHTNGRPFDLVTHSLHVHDVVAHLGGTPLECRTAAGHDAHEAFVGDVSRPLKLAMREISGAWSAFDVLERAAAQALADRFDWQYPHPDIVKHADNLVLGWEADAIWGEGTAAGWGLPTDCPPRSRLLDDWFDNRRRLVNLLEPTTTERQP